MISFTCNEPLDKHHTFGVKAISNFYIETDNPTELFQFIRKNPEKTQKKLIIGEGSNLLFTKDYDGLIIHPVHTNFSEIQRNEEEVLIECDAGKNWDEFVSWTVDQGFWGLENLSSIPGSVGASPVQNIGAYGVEAKDLVSEVMVLDLKSLEEFWLAAESCNFEYRNSIFKDPSKEDWMVWKVRFTLRLKPNPKISYKDLIHAFPDKHQPSCKEIREKIIEIRSGKLPDPAKIRNAGSFFKNPIISSDQAQKLRKANPSLPVFAIPGSQDVKIAAGWLIEKSGLKGIRKGETGTYANQALVLVNFGMATGWEIHDLAIFIQNEVEKEFGIRLEPEVRIL